MAEDGNLGRVDGANSFAREAFETYHEHEQRSSYWRGHLEALVQSGVNDVVRSALGATGPAGVAVGIAYGASTAGLGHVNRQAALEQAELANMLGMASREVVSDRRRERNIGLVSDIAGIGVGAIGSVISAADFYAVSARAIAVTNGPEAISQALDHGTISLTGSDVWPQDSEPRSASEYVPATEARNIIRP